MSFIKILSFSIFVSFFVSTLFAFEVDYNKRDSLVTIKDFQLKKVFTVAVPNGVIKVSKDIDNLYFLNSNKKQLSIISYNDIFPINSNGSVIHYGIIDLSLEVSSNNKILDMTVLPGAGSSVIFLSMQNLQTNRISINSYEIQKKVAHSKIIDEDQGGQEVNTLFDSSAGLFSIRKKDISVLGDGSIEVILDGADMRPLLLTLDRKNSIIHEYNIFDPRDPQYKRSYSLANLKLDLIKENFKLSNISASDSHINLENDKKRFSLSLVRLRKELAINRTYFLTNWQNEVVGNIWTKQLLGLGALSSVIDWLDELYGNPNLDIDRLLDNPQVKLITSSLSEQDVFNWMKSSKLFSEEEVAQMHYEYKKNSLKGRKWFTTVSVAAGLFGFMTIKSMPIISKERTGYIKGIELFVVI